LAKTDAGILLHTSSLCGVCARVIASSPAKGGRQMQPSAATATLICLLAAPALTRGFALSPAAKPLTPPSVLTRGKKVSCGLTMASKDTHVSLAPTFTVPEGKMGDFKAAFPTFYDATKGGTDLCLYYGFAQCGDKVFCREGYKDAAGALAHVGEVGEALGKAMAMVGEGGVSLDVHGPKEELDKLKDALGPLGAKFYEMDGGAMWFGREKKGTKDTHVTIFPIFTVHEGKMDAFQATFSKFYAATKQGTDECLYYGFATSGNQVFCREGYASAAGALAHMKDVGEPLKEAMAMADVKPSVMGPAAELEKLKGTMDPAGWDYYVLDEGGFWK